MEDGSFYGDEHKKLDKVRNSCSRRGRWTVASRPLPAATISSGNLSGESTPSATGALRYGPGSCS